MNPLLQSPLIPVLQQLSAATPPNSFVVAGGLGLILKQEFLTQSQTQTLVPEVPEARATTDIDILMQLQLFTDPELPQLVRQEIEKLGFEATMKYMIFQSTTKEGQSISIDLMAPPYKGVPTRNVRVGSGTPLHGRLTPEAFAVMESPPEVSITLSSGDFLTVSLPHAYCWLNMKVRASHDWHTERETRGPSGAKHTGDVIRLLAMMTEDEMNQSAKIADQFRDHLVAQEIKGQAVKLFGTEDAPGWLAAVREAPRPDAEQHDHPLLWEALAKALGIQNSD